MKAAKTLSPRTDTTRIGWREWIGLPALQITSIKAKIDTGARTSALHAVNLRPFEIKGVRWIEFHVPRAGVPRTDLCRAIIVDERKIKNTSGVPKLRYVISTTLILGRRHWHIELSLADREKMEFDIILGRTAIRRHGLLVDPGRSFLAGPPIAIL
ncbi:MAG: ATP-dependent zinc protease [Alphaproteobacteria bacterium BRH_c36]|nr:MAG: ATP-dependent zinc protease [Alphaproteobacteria bacterium BRH_c36]